MIKCVCMYRMLDSVIMWLHQMVPKRHRKNENSEVIL